MPPKSRPNRTVASTVTVDSSDDEALTYTKKMPSNELNDDVLSMLHELTQGFESMKKSNDDMTQKVIDLSAEVKSIKTNKSYNERVESNISTEDKYKGERAKKMLDFLESKDIDVDDDIERSELIKLCIEHDYSPSKKKKKNVIDPNAPKKPYSTFIMFSNEFRAQIAEANPEMKQSDIAKILGTQWKELDEEDKEPYKESYKVKKDAYDIEFEAYQLTLETASVDSVESTTEDTSIKLDFSPKESKKTKEPKEPKESKKKPVSAVKKKKPTTVVKKKKVKKDKALPSSPREPEPEPEPEPQQDFSSQLNQSIETGGMTIDSDSDFDANSDSDSE
jgi:hypothetical protein